MNIITDENIDLLKLNYILFNKFDSKVPFILLDTSRKSGYIYPDGRIEYCKEAKPNNHCTLSHDFSDKNRAELDFTIDLDCLMNALVYNDIIEADSFSIHNKTTIVTEINDTDKYTDLIDRDKKNIILIIYPNNMIPALIRIYKPDQEFNILNIDDTEALYNTYYNNISIKTEKSIINHSNQAVSNVPFLKFENDINLQKNLSLLSSESYEDGVYHNDVLGITYSEFYPLKIADIEFDFNTLKDNILKDKFIGDLNTIPYFDKFKNMVSEICDIDILKSLPSIHTSDDSYVWFNGSQIIGKIKYQAVLKDYIAIIFTNNADDDLSELYVLDLEDQEVLIQCNISNEDKSIEYIDAKNLHFEYHGRLKPDINLHIIAIIRDLNEQILSNVKSYSIFGETIWDTKMKLNTSTYVSKVLSGEDKKGKYILFRGILGNLMKKYI